MSLHANIEQDFTTAMRDKDQVSMAVLRMLKSALANKKIEKKLDKEAELPDAETLAVIKTEIKKRKDSSESYKQAGRNDLAEIEDKEIVILEKYLPEQMSEDDIKKLIEETITQTGASGASDFGKVMGAVMGKTAGQADGEVVSRLVKESLAK